MEQENHYLSAIQKRYPDLIDPEAGFKTDGGQYNDILIFDNHLVFRFPKYAESVRQILQEIEILQKVREHLPLPVPDPIYSSTETQAVGHVFSRNLGCKWRTLA